MLLFDRFTLLSIIEFQFRTEILERIQFQEFKIQEFQLLANLEFELIILNPDSVPVSGLSPVLGSVPVPESVPVPRLGLVGPG